jgi:alcohol dehydrogenase class IV
MTRFIYEQQPARILFGYPILKALTEEISIAASANLWVIASHRFDSLVQQIDELKSVNVLEHFSRVLQHVPHDQVQKARHAVAKSNPDIILAIGGGSAIGLAKAVALKHQIPIWAVPTTYSGSEMTNIYGISSGKEKSVGRSDQVIPGIVFYDPQLSVTLPKRAAATSAINALAHLVEAAYSPSVNPFTLHQSFEGMRIMLKGLQKLAKEESLTFETNTNLLLGACFAGKSLSEAEMGLHHKCAHVLGGSYGLDHSLVHTVLLPYVLSYQWDSLPESIKDQFKEIFNSDSPAQSLMDLIDDLGLPTALKSIGFNKSNAAEAASKVVELDFQNPAPVTQQSVQALLENA